MDVSQLQTKGILKVDEETLSPFGFTGRLKHYIFET